MYLLYYETYILYIRDQLYYETYIMYITDPSYTPLLKHIHVHKRPVYLYATMEHNRFEHTYTILHEITKTLIK